MQHREKMVIKQTIPTYPEPAQDGSIKRWVIVLVVLFVLALLSLMFAGLMTFMSADSDIPVLGSATVAVIPIEGVITTAEDDLFSDVANSRDIVDLIKEADNNPNVKAIVFEINSPGGSPVASEEIANAIKQTSKPTVAYIREVGASGGYWIASATDRIFASRMSITGSIGVIGSYLEFDGLLDKYNITYRRLVGGKYKDIGSPFKELTPY